MMNKKTLLKILYVLLVLLLLAFIFGNSMKSIPASTEQSDGIREYLNKIFSSLGLKIYLSEVFVRKTAHFLEFFTVGFVLSLSKIVFDTKKIRNVHIAFLSCLVAMTDETIQYFYERGSMLLDVWLDFSSALVGLLLFCVIYRISNRKKH